MGIRSFRPNLEGLEERVVPYALNGYEWANVNVSASFMPDQTPLWSSSNNLFATYDGRYATTTWQRELARALQTWATVTPLNFHFVQDSGLASGTSGPPQGDSRFGDIRLGALPRNDGYLAYAHGPYPTGTAGGDVVLNSSSIFNIGTSYDLYSVLVHEVGHALGLGHSTAWNSVMYPAVTDVYTGLFPDDVAGIQAIYGARQPDAFDSQIANDTFTFATWLSLVDGGATIDADLTTLVDVDYYRVMVPEGSDGTLTVSLDARGISLLSPSVAVYDTEGSLVASASAGSVYGTVAQVTLSGLTPGQMYTIMADGATSDVFGMGAYRLNLQFGGDTPSYQSLSAFALPAFSWSSTFPVYWPNQAATSSEITGYDVYVSVDGGPFTLWLGGTTANSAVFTGEFDHVYEFQVIAIDSAGQSVQTSTVASTQVASPFTVGSVPEDATSAAGVSIAVLTAELGEIEPGPIKGIAIADVSGNGIWQFSLNKGRTWHNLGSPSTSAARLLRSTDRIRFLPARDWNGTAVASYHVWNRTAGVVGQTVDVSALGGGNRAFGVGRYGGAITVMPGNDAPVLPPAVPLLPDIGRTENDPVGSSVSQLLAGVSDADPDAVGGIAVVATTGRGTWQYSRDGGPWTNLGAVSARRARLLRDTDLIRFVPHLSGSFNGTATIRYRAWDQSNPQALTANLSRARSYGGRTPYSAGIRTARLLVNDAPALRPPFTSTTTSIAEDTRSRWGHRIDSFVLPSSITDDDPRSLRGVAVVAATGTGTWQYSLNNGRSWRNFGTLSESAVRLLRATDRIRFLPAVNWNGTATLNYRAWDRMLGGVGGILDLNLSGVGGHSCCSADTAEVTINVTAVNDAPVLSSTPVSLSGISRTEGVDVALLLGGAQDADGDLLGVAITGMSGGGTWQFSIGNGVWQTLGSLSSSSALLLGEGDRLRFVPFEGFTDQVWLTLRAWDGTAGTAGSTADLSGYGGQTAFSIVNRLATLLVTEEV